MSYNPIETRIRAHLPIGEQMETDLKRLIAMESEIRRMANYYVGMRFAGTLDLCADKLTVAAAAISLKIERERDCNAHE